MRKPHVTGTALHLLTVALLLAAGVASQAESAVDNQWDASGRVTVRGTDWTASLDKNSGALALTRREQTVRLTPLTAEGKPAQAVSACTLAAEGAEVVVRAAFKEGAATMEAAFRLSERGTVTLEPGAGFHGISIGSPLAAGILPGDQIEDVMYIPAKFKDLERVCVPSENWFAGLIDGGNGIVACAWPGTGQHLSLERKGDELFSGLTLTPDGKPLYLEILAAPSIWYCQHVGLDCLEKTMPLDWKPPFRAQYKTQLCLRAETSAQRTFTFISVANEQWRPEVGSVTWPVWFEKGKPVMRLTKKIPPRDDAYIYPFKENEKSLIAFVKRTPVGETIIDRNKLAPLPHGSRGAKDVGFIACGGTLVMRKGILALGLQNREKEFLEEYAEFLADYVDIVQKRNAGFFDFIDRARVQLKEWRAASAGASELRAYFDDMLAHANDTEQHVLRKMNYFGNDSAEAHMADADRTAKRMKELLDTKGTEVYPELDALVERQNRLSWGHIEMTGGRFSMMAREWAQQAAYGCADLPEAAEHAAEVRSGIRQAISTGPAW